MTDYSQVPSPCYLLEETLLRKNLALIKQVKERAGVDIILAFKAFAMWRAFPIVREYIQYSTASSPSEAQLAYEEMGNLAHSYSPAYTPDNFDSYLRYSSHITFNSLSQYERFYPKVLSSGKNISCGLRINPEYSEVETALYNPCAPGSRLGITASQMGNNLPKGIAGLHFHSLCESSSYDLEKTLQAVEEKFGSLLSQIQWLNMGGGHLMTQQGYNIEHLIQLLTNLKKRYPQLQIILEPGSAFAWQTGTLIASVVDVVENHGIKTAILNISFACHTPDCLEMPYQPAVRGAEKGECSPYVYRLGGNSCLSGDYMGNWSFDHPLEIGERLIFEDMMHYTTVKTHFFNGISHPAIALLDSKDKLHIWREYGYQDYKHQMC